YLCSYRTFFVIARSSERLQHSNTVLQRLHQRRYGGVDQVSQVVAQLTRVAPIFTATRRDKFLADDFGNLLDQFILLAHDSLPSILSNLACAFFASASSCFTVW